MKTVAQPRRGLSNAADFPKISRSFRGQVAALLIGASSQLRRFSNRLEMEAVRETAVGSPGGRHATITLQAETRTPRARTLSASFVRERTPLGELPPAQRQRKKNEGKARARALDRLDPVKHEMYLESERVRKRDAALSASHATHAHVTASAKEARQTAARATPIMSRERS